MKNLEQVREIWWMNVYKNENKNVSTSPNFGKYVQCYFFIFFKELVNTLVWPPGSSYPDKCALMIQPRVIAVITPLMLSNIAFD